MNPLLTIIYYTLYGLVKMGLWVYYRIEPSQGLPAQEPKGPLIVLGNHPNALIDPFMVVSRLTRPVFFLGNASLFKHWFANWFLNTFYCIPIERPKDVGGRPLDNAQAFKRSREHLMGGGALYIAPEGTSEREYCLRPIKTGAARIALDVLFADPTQVVGFLLGGITYQTHPVFRSRVSLRFDYCEISISDLPDEADDWGKVEWLTQHLELRMQALLLHSAQEVAKQLMECKQLLQPGFDKADWRDSLHALLDRIEDMGAEAKSRISTLGQLLKEKQLTAIDPEWLNRRESLGRLLFLPVAVSVLIHHLVIYGLPELLKRTLKLHLVYDASIRYLGGLIGYLVGVPLLWWMMGWFVEVWEYRLIWIVLVLALGPWSWQQWLFFQRVRQWRSFKKAARDSSWRNRIKSQLAPLTGQQV